MNAIWLAMLSLLGFLVAYFVYGRFLSTKILELDPNRKTPAQIKEDGEDYVPTNRFVLFGHHFASIAGLGPILGPAIAVIWGWLPALLWVVFGTILLGAVHDLVSLGLSLRHEGRSLGDITNDIIGGRARILFLCIIFFALALAMGVFALVIAQLFTNFHPQAVIPTFSLIAVAVLMGICVYKFNINLSVATVVGLLLVFGALIVGVNYPVSLYDYFMEKDNLEVVENHRDNFARYCLVTDYGESTFEKSQEGALAPHILPLQKVKAEKARLDKEGKVALSYLALDEANASRMIRYFSALEAREKAAEKREKAALYAGVVQSLKKASSQAAGTWIWVLLFYALVASVLPVWLLLQPRDYLNSFQLYAGCFLMYGGLFIFAPMMVAPSLNTENTNFFTTHPTTLIPALIPFLFITVACGAISGFHCLVASGTTVRQLKRETDATFVAYGGMLTEGALAVIVILACTAGFPSEASWNHFYHDWKSASGLGAKLAAFVNGAGVFISQWGIPLAFAKTFIAVVAVGFAMTTLDSATRLLRYNIEEFSQSVESGAIRPLENKYLASFIAILAIAFFAFLKFDGKPAGLILWGLFGTTNQLLGGVALLLGTIYLYKKNKPIIFTFAPMVFMLIMTLGAMSLNWYTFLQKGNLPLIIVGGVLMIMTVWLCIEAYFALRAFRSGKGEESEVSLSEEPAE